MDTNECRIYLNTWRRTQESKSNSSQQKGLSGVVWCGEVVWCVASGGEVVAKWMERVMSRDWTARAAYASSLHQPGGPKISAVLLQSFKRRRYRSRLG
jgi:hypothetical protein